jgi:DNA-binding SARP family transcriptional activator
MHSFSVNLLGGFDLRNASGAPISLPTRKAEALVAYLALTAPVVQSREKLAGLLWGDSATEQARQSLRQTLFTIRRAAGDVELVTGSDRLTLDATGILLDTAEFEQLAHETRREPLEQAAALWKGGLLEGLEIGETEFDGWLAGERARFEEIAISLFRRLVAIYSDEGESDTAIQMAHRLLAVDPLQEQIHRELMRLYVRQRRFEAAVRQYQDCSAMLRRHLGIDPSPQTTELYREVFRERSAAGTGGGGQPLRRRILLVEDNALTAKLLIAYLREANYDVVHAADGASALLEIGRSRPDLLLLDFGLPKLDGLAVLQTISQNGLPIPTIIITAAQEAEVELQSLDAGAADFVRKPIEKTVILKRIERALRNAGHEATLAAR